jgi:hypothetical protein
MLRVALCLLLHWVMNFISAQDAGRSLCQTTRLATGCAYCYIPLVHPHLLRHTVFKSLSSRKSLQGSLKSALCNMTSVYMYRFVFTFRELCNITCSDFGCRHSVMYKCTCFGSLYNCLHPHSYWSMPVWISYPYRTVSFTLHTVSLMLFNNYFYYSNPFRFFVT